MGKVRGIPRRLKGSNIGVQSGRTTIQNLQVEVHQIEVILWVILER